MKQQRAALIGIDHYHATGWSDSVLELDDCIDVVALYDSDPERGKTLTPKFYDPHLSAKLDERYRGAAFETDLDALLQNHDIDLAIVTLQNTEAPAAITKLAEHGVHMLVDKPSANSAAEAREAVEAARLANVRLAVGFTRRYGRAWQHTKELIDQGRLGDLRSAEAIFNTSSVEVRNPENHIFNADLNHGGILLWLGIHDVDQLLWMTGQKVVEVQAMAATETPADIGVEDTISISLRFENGALATMHYAYVLPRDGSDGYLAFRGSERSVKLSPAGAVTWIGSGSIDDPLLEETMSYTSRPAKGYGTMGTTIIADLLDAIEENREPLSNGDNLVNALEIIDAVYESARTGKRVKI